MEGENGGGREGRRFKGWCLFLFPFEIFFSSIYFLGFFFQGLAGERVFFLKKQSLDGRLPKMVLFFFPLWLDMNL